MSAAGGACALAFDDFITDLERLIATCADAEEHAVKRLHAGAHALRAAEEFCLNDICRDSDQHYRCGHRYPAVAGISHLWLLLLPRKWYAALLYAAFRFAAASDAVMQMRFNQQGAGRG